MFLWKISGTFLLVLCVIFGFISFIYCQPTYNRHRCLGSVNETASNTYISNLDSLLNSLSSKASVNSFYNDSSYGIYSLFLCRGDVSAATCQTCVSNATQLIRQRCPTRKRAIIWYDECMLRYSKVSFFGRAQTSPWLMMWNIQNTTSPDGQNYRALGLIYSLIDEVPYTEMMFGTDEKVVANGNQRGYALVQCTRDINSSSCRSCLGQLTEEILQCCQSRRGWRILSPSCYLRYEENLFYHKSMAPVSPVPVTPQPTPSYGGKEASNTKKIAIITVSSLAAAGAALLGFWYYSSSCRKQRPTGEGMSEEILLPNFKGSNHPELEGGLYATVEDHSGEMHCFSLTAIQTATNNFSDANKLGQGGFGPVYKGELPNGKEIAVKRLSIRSSQGLEEFRNEVILIIKLQHKNLVRLLGYCLEGDENFSSTSTWPTLVLMPSCLIQLKVRN
ncbi:hypothetical protein ACOSP7_012290 [Xanthoceras sorbifolium]